MDSNRKVIHLIILVSMLFLSIIVYLTYFQVFRADSIVENPYNKRTWAREENTIRGTIYDRNGIILAETEVEGETLRRNYPYGNLYSHLIGYSNRQYGRAGIESYYNNQLMALNTGNVVSKLQEWVAGRMIKGNDLVLTIDHQLQRTAEQLLQGKTGSIVAVDPTTGEVLAMVSKPDFNPNTLAGEWTNLVGNEKSPLLNRGIAGLYPPGSTYKTVIAAGVLESGNIDSNYNCTGTITIEGYSLSDFNYEAHGYLDLRRSLVVSCNTNFARMSVALGKEKVTEISKRFFMDKKIDSDMPISQSRFPYNGKMSSTDLAAVGIGQGKLMVTPLHMALIASTFANDGVMMEPYIVREIRSPKGRTLETASREGNRIISSEIASSVKEMMVGVVWEGTGRNAAIPWIKVAGKTGTAENPTGANHAWFIGFAPADRPQIAVAVLLENEGRTGGAAAAPLAREVMRQYIGGGVQD